MRLLFGAIVCAMSVLLSFGLRPDRLRLFVRGGSHADHLLAGEV
jgi:hypothetical protein